MAKEEVPMILTDDEAYAIFLIMDSLARVHRGEDPTVNHLRERLIPVYREWHRENPGMIHPELIADKS
jgi:hypothetical protein